MIYCQSNAVDVITIWYIQFDIYDLIVTKIIALSIYICQLSVGQNTGSVRQMCKKNSLFFISSFMLQFQVGKTKILIAGNEETHKFVNGKKLRSTISPNPTWMPTFELWPSIFNIFYFRITKLFEPQILSLWNGMTPSSRSWNYLIVIPVVNSCIRKVTVSYRKVTI